MPRKKVIFTKIDGKKEAAAMREIIDKNEKKNNKGSGIETNIPPNFNHETDSLADYL